MSMTPWCGLQNITLSLGVSLPGALQAENLPEFLLLTELDAGGGGCWGVGGGATSSSPMVFLSVWLSWNKRNLKTVALC